MRPTATGALLDVGVLLDELQDLRVGNGARHAVAAQDELVAGRFQIAQRMFGAAEGR